MLFHQLFFKLKIRHEECKNHLTALCIKNTANLVILGSYVFNLRMGIEFDVTGFGDEIFLAEQAGSCNHTGYCE